MLHEPHGSGVCSAMYPPLSVSMSDPVLELAVRLSGAGSLDGLVNLVRTMWSCVRTMWSCVEPGMITS